MRTISILSVACLVLAACGSTSSNSDLKQARANNTELRKAAFENARQVQVGALQFNVAVLEGSYAHNVEKPGQSGVPSQDKEVGLAFVDRPFALVELVKPASASYTARQVEAAAKSATGCNAKFSAGVLAFVGLDADTADLQVLDKNVSNLSRGWRADLLC